MEAVNWVEWYDQTPAAVDYLEAARNALVSAGFTAEPETVLEVGRHLLSDPNGGQKLRSLAEIWEKRGKPAPWLSLVRPE